MPTVLVIEDDRLLQRGLQFLLYTAGYKGLSAQNGTDGIALAHKHHPDIVLCDVIMPDMNGFEVAEELQLSPNTAHIPIIFLTAQPHTETPPAARLLGVKRHLQKPASPQDILNALSQCVQQPTRPSTIATEL
jgi:CheY-like chemotaxis protein